VSEKKVKQETENGEKKVEVCREFDLVYSTIQRICKNRTRIISAFEQNGSRINRLRKPDRSDADEELLKWFKQQRSDNVPVSRPQVI
jgi:hypothetical protein